MLISSNDVIQVFAGCLGISDSTFSHTTTLCLNEERRKLILYKYSVLGVSESADLRDEKCYIYEHLFKKWGYSTPVIPLFIKYAI